MFATSMGTARRNDLSDFKDIRRNGKIAMKLDEGESLVAVKPCTDDAHVLIATRAGKAIRFAVDEIRVFKSRDSVGVRAVKLAKDDVVVSMSVLNGIEANAEQRAAFIKYANAKRRAAGEEADDAAANAADAGEETTTSVELSEEEIAKFEAAEEILLTITENGYGKRTSAYEYRQTGRGGQGITNIVTSSRNGLVVATFPVETGDQIILMTDQAKIIRTSIEEIRIAGRNTQGVTIFRTADKEKVVSAVRIGADMAGSDDEDNAEEHVQTEGNAATTESSE